MMRYLSSAVALLAMLAGLGMVLNEPVAVAADDDWTTVKGQIVWPGDPPKPKELDKVKESQDKAHCLGKGPIFSEEWVVNKDTKGMRWVFVWLISDDGKTPLTIHPSLKEVKVKNVEIDQPCCKFIPHALAMRQGQDLIAKNTSPVAHNVYCQGHPARNPARNPLVPAGKSVTLDGLVADEKFPVSVSCKIHPWMSAWVRVYDHPYYALTDEKGNFEIKMAPVGDCRLKIWHESGWLGGADGRDGRKITLKKGAVNDLGKIEWKQ
jgi:hypothetical protein